MSEDTSLDEIRQRKAEQLRGDGDGGNRDDGGGGDDDGGGDGDGDGGESAPTDPIQVDSADHLDDVTGTYDVVLADFYADWCGPCKMIEPIVADIAAETPAAVAKVDVDGHQQLSAEYGVRGVPTLVLFADGEPAERIVGMQGEDELYDLVEQYS